MSVPISPFLPPTPFPLGIHTFVLYVCLYFCFANKVIYTIFSRFHIYALIYVGVCSFIQMQLITVSFPCYGCPRCSAMLWCGVRGSWSAWAGVHSEVVSQNLIATRVDLSLPCLRANQHLCAPHKWNPSFSRLSLCPSGSPSNQWVLSPPHRSPGLRCPVCGLTYSLPRAGVYPSNLPFPLSFLPGAQVPTQSLFFPSYPIVCVSFLQPWLYRSPVSFQLVFSENCSTCRCIFDVFR